MSTDLDALYKTSPEFFPKTVAVALDGNRRWTEAHGFKEIEGHRLSIENMKNVITRAAELGITSITFWIFSTENFHRDNKFKDMLFSLAREYLQSGKYFSEISDLGGKLKIVGDLSLFPKDIAEKTMTYIQKSNPKKHIIDVVFAFGYGGRDEIVRAIKKLVKAKAGIETLTEETFSNYLDLPQDVDLLIRTGDRIRTSGLYVWQASYAELYFTPTLCPDFTVPEFEKAILDFTTRVRNFGR